MGLCEMKQVNWEDLRYVLAVVEAGTLAGAARALGVNHATVLRRVDAFEQAVGVAVFERTARGYNVAPHRARVLAAIRAMEEATFGVERALTAARSPVSGVVRVTSTDTFCLGILSEITADIQRDAEGLVIELESQNQLVDLSRLDADVAVRPASKLPPQLTGVIAAQVALAVYAAPQCEDRWLGLSGRLAATRVGTWLADAIPAAKAGARSDSFAVLRELAAFGQGRAILPCILGDPDPRLLRIDNIIPDLPIDLWVGTHVDMAEVPRIRMVKDLIIAGLERAKPRLLGLSG